MKIKGFIYKITNNINNHIYIGKTNTSIEYRFKRHIIDSKKDKLKYRPLYRAMNKYGIENFSISLVEECDENLLSEREQYWIKYYNSYENGYNATLGGDGSVLYNYDDILNMYKNGMTGAEICKSIGCERGVVQRYLKGFDINPFENAINRTKKKVFMLDKNNNQILNSFNSYSDAAQWLIDNNYSIANKSTIRTNIGRVVEGKRKTCYGFIWRNNPNW